MDGIMRLFFVADGRSPIALNWIRYFVDRGHEVHLASTFPCSPDLELAGQYLVPVALSQAAGEARQGNVGGGSGRIKKALPVGLRTAIRQWVGPLTLPGGARRLRRILTEVRPDLVHAMRIPYEGMLAALAEPEAPLLISIWGNDFTLHSPSTPLMRRLTRRALARANALHTDCQRDFRLAIEWGYPAEGLSRVLPGGGGIQLDVFHPAGGSGLTDDTEVPFRIEPAVINPRGIRAYVRNDTFFKAIPRVLESMPEVRFLCPVMRGEAQAEGWVRGLGIGNHVELLPRQSREQMARLFRRAQVAVSPSEHDGTPNTLLEAMACGCFPVAGDIEPLREWITNGENGLLVDPGDPNALAQAILTGLQQASLREKAREINRRLIAERADYRQVMMEAEGFYQEIVSG
jgi:glycosyltransferase involved in cell wall biosynthesis